MWEDICIALGVIFGIIMLCVGLYALDYLLDKKVFCPKFSENVQLEYKFDYLAGGCFVNYDGQWIKKESLRAGNFD